MNRTRFIIPSELNKVLLEFPPIITVRKMKVILDVDLARIYGASTKALNQAIKRNREKFPDDFMFHLTQGEIDEIQQRSRSQFVTLKRGQNIKYLPHAFSEHGAIMAATVLNSPRAVQMSIFVVRAFIKMRAALGRSGEPAKKLAKLERELKKRLNVHESAIVTVLQRVMDLLDPPPFPEPPKRRMGFGVEEREAVYGRSGHGWRRRK